MAKRSAGQYGWTLVEILVVIFISSMVIAAIIQIFVGAKENMRLQDNLARMQEHARIAIQTLQEDIRMAGFTGEIQEYWNIEFSAAQPATANIAGECFNDTATSGHRWIAPFVSIGDGAGGTPILIPPKLAGQDDGNSSFVACVPNADYRADSDVLTVHYVGPGAVADAALVANTYYIRTNLFNGFVFRSDGTAPPAPATYSSGPNNLNFPLRAFTYYVSNSNTAPALRRVELDASGALVTNNIAEGVVGMQIRYGIDTDSPADGIANRYVDANDALLGGFRNSANWNAWGDVRTVRIWLMMRSPDQFPGYTDSNATYAMGDLDSAFTPVAGYRYQLFVTTIAIRNGSGDEP